MGHWTEGMNSNVFWGASQLLYHLHCHFYLTKTGGNLFETSAVAILQQLNIHAKMY